MSSIIEKIRQRGAEAEAQMAAQTDAQIAESQKPDAEAQASDGRTAHRQAFEQMVDGNADVQMVEPGAEEQAVMTKMEQAMIEMIHGQGMSKKMLAAVTTAQDPVHGIGTVASDIVLKLSREIPGATDDVLEALGTRTVEEIVEVAEVADPRLNFSEDDMAEAFSIGVQNVMKSGMVNVDENEMRGFIADG